MGLTTSKVLYVPPGSIHKIIAYLQRENPDITALDAFALRFAGRPQRGWIDLGDTRMTHADFLYRLCTSKAAMRPVTLIPGETTWVFFEQVAERFGLDHGKLMAAMKMQSPRTDGALVPDTYQLPLGIDENRTVALLLERSDKRMKVWSRKLLGHWKEKEWFRYVTVASIIQKEAATAGEMPIVSSVIANRLARGMKLQMDGTLNYGRHSHQAVTAGRLRSDKSSYNTYLYKGLPPAPVCNPGFEAIRAAVFPADTDYLYFVRGPDGRHRFSRYYSTHIRNLSNVTK